MPVPLVLLALIGALRRGWRAAWRGSLSWWNLAGREAQVGITGGALPHAGVKGGVRGAGLLRNE